VSVILGAHSGNGRFRAVVWDVDGVLIDSEPLHFESLTVVCARHGHVFGDADNKRWLGKSFPEMWAGIPALRALGPSFEGLRAELIDYYVARVHGGMARAPAPAIVAALAARGVPQAAASSSPRPIVEANVAAVGAKRHLAAALAVDDVAAGKPAPDLYLAAAARLGVPPASCLAIEDTSTGIAAAKAAGFSVIAWPHPMTAAMDFSAADFRLRALDDFDWEARVGA